MAQVTLKGVFKTYPSEKGGEVVAVRDFNLEIKESKGGQSKIRD